MRLGLSGVTRLMQQCRLPMVFDDLFKLHSRLTMEELRGHDGCRENVCVCVAHVHAMMGQRSIVDWRI